MSRRRRSGDATSMAEMFGDLRADYDAIKVDALTRKRVGLAPMGASADWHIRFEWQYLHFMELARDVDRNDIVVGQGIDRIVSNVVQDGFNLDPQTGDDDTNKRLIDWWHDWANDKRLCHYTQTCDWHDIENLTLRNTIVDGDMFNLLLDLGSIDTVEGHRCRRPTNTIRNVVFGILKNDAGQAEEVWLTKENIQPMQQLNLVSGISRHPIYDDDGNLQVLHGVLRRRFSFTRGITALAPIFKVCGLHDDIQFAELVKRQVQSCIAFMREKPLTNTGTVETGTMGEAELRPNENTVRLLQQIYPGMEVEGNPGEMLKAFAPNVAGSDFVSHAMLVLTFIAVNLNLPVHVLMLDPSHTNFSGWRGAIEQARIRWRQIQRWLKSNLHRPTYAWKVRGWAAEDSKRGYLLREAARKGADLFKHIWHTPGWAYIEPLKDAQADTLRQISLLTSPRRVLGESQLDHKRIVDETVADHFYEISKAIDAAKQLEQKYGIPIDWHELLGKSLPQGVTMALNATTEPDPADKPPADKKSKAA